MNLEFTLENPNFSATDTGGHWWPIRPNTGLWWADILWLSIIAALNQHIIPSIFGSGIPIDILTPWLVVSFVVESPFKASTIWLLGAMFLETSTDAPKGLYLCAYWIVLSTLLLSRKTLSWKHAVPWLVTFFFASFWIGNFETLMIFLRQDAKQLDFMYFFGQLIRVIISCLFGMTLAQPWMTRFKGERVRGDLTKAERMHA
jgi:hypothetical protein